MYKTWGSSMQTFLSYHVPVQNLREYPDGYFWPVELSGKKAAHDTHNWKIWWKENHHNYLRVFVKC